MKKIPTAARYEESTKTIRIMTRFVIEATVRGIGPILCTRPYPRPRHTDPFTWDTRDEAELFAAQLSARFPDSVYSVRED